MIRVLVFFALLNTPFASWSQEILTLWPEGVPNQRKSNQEEKRTETDILRIENVQDPTLEVYLPAKSIRTGKAVLICPGGGYHLLAYDWEGTDFAKALNARGIAAFVLKYRLPTSPSLIDPKWAPLQDAQRAIRLIRTHFEKWEVNPNQIGVLGFSAGGHLASTLGTHYKENTLQNSTNLIDQVSARPDFLALIYPVITFDNKHTHRGSKTNLIGKDAPVALVNYFSNNLHVDAHTPPSFLLHSANDKAVPVANSLLFYDALIENGVPAEMHLYPKGGHGFALARGKGALEEWPELLFRWILDLE